MMNNLHSDPTNIDPREKRSLSEVRTGMCENIRTLRMWEMEE